MSDSDRIGRFFGFGKRSRRRRTLEKVVRVRAHAGARKPVPRREAAIATLCGLNLVALPWADAGYSVGAQSFAFITAALAFAYLFLPVGYDERRSATAGESFALLVRCVPFWCGLALLALFVTQGLNPAATVMFDGRNWLVLPETPVAGLPAGVAAPFARAEAPGGMNAFRTALVFAPAWLTFCALWCGVRGRRVTLRLAFAVAFSSGALAVMAIGLRAAGRAPRPAYHPAAGDSLFGTFFYQNQGGAYFALAAAVAFSAALAYWTGAASAGRRGGAYQPLVVLASVAALAAPASFSFGALASVGALVPAVLVAYAVCRSRLRGLLGEFSFVPSAQMWAVGGLAAVALGALACFGDYRGISDKVAHKMSLVRRDALDDRAPIRAATLRMYADTSAVWGYGAGAYRWVSPKYFAQDPFFCDAAGKLKARSNHAHGDWLQMLAEWGAAGLGLVLLGLGWVLFRLRRVFTATAAAAWPVAAGLLILAAHAGADCLLFNPAIALLAAFSLFFARTLSHVANT